MKYLIILFSILAIGCGKVKVQTDLPDKVHFGPDFEQASLFCDNKYGVGTPQSEDCFQDYRTFLSPKISIDLASIQTFCKGSYSSVDEIAQCEKDLLDIIESATEIN